jgi:uncharacterized membrane protein YeaQ/YmgE (transglycosylase-associated protein family)
MNALDFILSDVKKKKRLSPLAFAGLALLVLVGSLVLGYLWRDDAAAGLRAGSFIAAIAGFVLTLVLLRLSLQGDFFSKKTMAALVVLSLGALLLSIQTALLNPSTVYATAESFWFETWKCFFKGMVSTAVVGMMIGAFAFRFTSWPTRNGRLLLCLCSALLGALMLEIHCDSASLAHVSFGHLLQGVVVGAVIFCAMLVPFLWKFKGVPNPHKLG